MEFVRGGRYTLLFLLFSDTQKITPPGCSNCRSHLLSNRPPWRVSWQVSRFRLPTRSPDSLEPKYPKFGNGLELSAFYDLWMFIV
jgi:hypothetical protein